MSLSMQKVLLHSLVLIWVAAIGCSRLHPDEENQQTLRSTLLEPGVSSELANLRASTISDLRYEIFLSIPATVEDPVTGSITARFDYAKSNQPLVFDFAQSDDHVLQVIANGEPADFTIQSEHIVIASESLRSGPTEISIDFVAGDGSLNRRDKFLYTLFVPARARVALPIFDQPNLKAQYELRLEMPAGWRAITNGAPTSEHSKDGRTTVDFAQTQPISSYLFAFAAGEFEIERLERGDHTMRMFHRETDADKVARNLEAIFDLHIAALDWLESYTAIPYPFEKFDFIAIPAFQFGGMEHPGAIFYRDRSLFLDESATQRQYLDRASLISHETAHMWFGDLVTMEWFDDVWMKEVFASFMADKIANPLFPELNHDLAFLLEHYPSAYAVDRTAGTNPIRQPLGNLDDAGSLYGNIIYDKAPIVMKHLEVLVGEEVFRQGLREYLDANRYGNASWPDLIEVLDQISEEDLESWSSVWVNEAGRPTISTNLERDDATITSLSITQVDPDQKARLWNQNLNLLLGSPPSPNQSQMPGLIPLQLDKNSVDVPEVEGREVPRYVLPNGAGLGYGYFRLDQESLDSLLSDLPDIADPLIRGVAWITLWDALLEAEIEPKEFVDLANRVLRSEENEQVVQRVLRYLDGAYWKYLSADDRKSVAASVEEVVWSRLQSAPSTTLKSTFLEAFRDLAITPEGIALLAEIWQGSRGFEGLTLSENDTTALAEALALRGVADAERILDEQLSQIENPDRRERFEFVRPALSADPRTRDEFFASLADSERRSRERWVVDAVGYLHHPLRADHAEHYIRPSLDLLEEIQQTGTIFFPLSWLSSTLGGHNSKQAAAVVEAFLNQRPDLPVRLRGKTLQAADPLFRAAAIVDSEEN